MIYRLVYRAGDAGEGIDLYAPGDYETDPKTGEKKNHLDILSPSLELELNSAGTLSFTIPPNHKFWDILQVFKGEIDVYEDGDIVWFGRPLQIVRDWNNQKVVTCEGALSYFNDSIQFPKTYKTNKTMLYEDSEHPNKTGFINDLILSHNNQVDPSRQIQIGNINIPNVAVYREVDYDTTSDCLQKMCLDVFGGYFILRKELNEQNQTYTRYLDWYKQAPYGSGQEINFGVNLLGISQDLNGSDIVTVLLPSGKDDLHVTNYKKVTEEEAPKNYNCTHESNDPFVVHVEGYKKYGRIVAQKNFSEYDTAKDLFLAAAEWLDNKNTDTTTIECTAADLHYIGKDPIPPKFRVGSMVKVTSQPHGLVGDLEHQDVNVFPMYKISTSFDTGIKKITVGTPPKKELTDILAPSSGSTRSSGGTDTGNGGGSSGGGGGGSVSIPVKSVLVNGTTVVHNKVAEVQILAGDGINVTQEDKGALRISSDSSAAVTDVLVNGTSVVQNHIASVSVPVLGVEVDDISVIDENGIAKIPEVHDVIANPLAMATEDLETLQIDGIVYDLPNVIAIRDVRVRESNYISYKMFTPNSSYLEITTLLDSFETSKVAITPEMATELEPYRFGDDIEVWFSSYWYYRILRDSEDHDEDYSIYMNYNTEYIETFEQEYRSVVDDNHIANIDFVDIFKKTPYENKITNGLNPPSDKNGNYSDMYIQLDNYMAEYEDIITDADSIDDTSREFYHSSIHCSAGPEHVVITDDQGHVIEDYWDVAEDTPYDSGVEHDFDGRKVSYPIWFPYVRESIYDPKWPISSKIINTKFQGYVYDGNADIYFTKTFTKKYRPISIRGIFQFATATNGGAGWPLSTPNAQINEIVIKGSNDGGNTWTTIDDIDTSEKGYQPIDNKGYFDTIQLRMKSNNAYVNPGYVSFSLTAIPYDEDHVDDEKIVDIWYKPDDIRWIKTSFATKGDIAQLQANFQAGVDDIYDACVAKGSTPVSTALSDVVNAIYAIPGGGGGGLDITKCIQVVPLLTDEDPNVVTADSQWSPRFAPWKALDGSDDTFWASDTYSTYPVENWLKIVLTEPVIPVMFWWRGYDDGDIRVADITVVDFNTNRTLFTLSPTNKYDSVHAWPPTTPSAYVSVIKIIFDQQIRVSGASRIELWGIPAPT